MKADERSVLTEAEVRRLKDAVAALPMWRVVVGLMVDEGLRVGEVFDLRGGDVDVARGVLRRPRVMGISDELLESMRGLVESLDENDRVFGWKWNDPQARREWRELTRRAGVEGMRLPALRSTAIARRFVAYAADGVARPKRDLVLPRRPGEEGVPLGG